MTRSLQTRDQALKRFGDVLHGGCLLATLEAVAVGRRMGMSLQAITRLLNRNSGRNWTTKVLLQALVDGRPSDVGITPAAMLENLSQAVSMGMDCGAPMPLTDLARGLLQIGVSTLGPDASMDQAVGFIGALAGAQIVDAPGTPAPYMPARHADPSLRVGHVGLGLMGSSVARRLMAARSLQVHGRHPQAVQALVAEGATVAPDLPSLARECDVIMISLPTSADVRDVVFGAAGLAAGLSPGKIIVDQTTADPTLTRSLAADLQAIGVTLIDAAFSGTPPKARAGTINIMCGGPAAALDKVGPILETISPNISYCGGTGTGHAGKLVNHAVAAVNRLLTYEAVAMGLEHGLALEDMAAATQQGLAWSAAAEKIIPALATRAPTASFRLDLMAKDLRLASRMAMDCGAPLLLSSLARNLFETGMNTLGDDTTLDDMARVFEQMAGLQFDTAQDHATPRA